jgi:hypothetical protein
MWVYEQATGRLSRNNAMLAMGYSGKYAGQNNPSMQDVPNVGPLPCGNYEIQAPIDSPKHGPYALPLIPDAANEMFGRSEFLIHGERLEGPPGLASEGCIICARYARERIWESGDHALQVVEVISTSEDSAWPGGN